MNGWMKWTAMIGVCILADSVCAQGQRRGGEPNPLMVALDANRDGVLSESEIESASTALKKLDKNGDGKLTRDELRSSSGGFGRNPRQRFQFQSLMQFDENKDGKLSAAELPERMSGLLNRADKDGDGFLTKEEIDAMKRNFGNSRNRQRGNRPPRPQ